MKKKVFKAILLIILIIVVVIGIPSIYKISIIKKSKKAYDNLENCDSYKYICKSYHYSGLDDYEESSISEVYYKDNVFKTYSSDNNEASKPSTVYHCCIENNMIEIYENMKKFQIFQGGFSSKLIFMNMQTIYDAFASVYFDMENTFKDVINTIYANALNICRFIKCKVSIETFEDQECYKFEDKMISPYGNDYWYTIYYIDKETLLPAGVECKYKPKDYEKGNYDKAIYQIYINCVTDEDVKLPDLIEYTQIVD